MNEPRPQANAPSRVEASLTFFVDTGEKPVYHASVGGEDSNRYVGLYEDHSVSIQNARAAGHRFDLDREGFTLVRHRTKVIDFFDAAEVERVYHPEADSLLRKLTGAERVVVFDHTLRAGSMATRRAKKVREPVQLVHNDYTDRSAAQRVRDLLSHEEADERLRRRFAVVNLWRPIGWPVEKSPLALCDARSVAPADLVPTERRAKDRVGEIQQAVFNPRHRWYYFPRMQADEVLLIKTYDSMTDGRARFTIHTSFEDPTSPEDAPERQSIETRCFLFFSDSPAGEDRDPVTGAGR